MSRPAVATLVFGVVAAVGFLLLTFRKPIGMLEGFAEEHFVLGYNLAVFGRFSGPDELLTVFRPPGYPMFVSLVLRGYSALAGVDLVNVMKWEVEWAVYVVQTLLLGLTSACLFLWLARGMRIQVAAIAAIVFGCNPYQQMLSGFLHYESLHVFMVVMSGSLLGLCLERARTSWYLLFACGLLWGLATLIRPMTLILPAFLLVGFLLLRGLPIRDGAKKCLIICLGMLVVIAPYTCRNYVVSGRVIPVNAQGGVAMWATTSTALPMAPNHYRWWTAWYPDGHAIYENLTKSTEYNLNVYMRDIIEIEDEFKARARENLRTQPRVYLSNMARNLLTYCMDINSVMLGTFMAIQEESPIQFKTVVYPGALQPAPFRGGVTRLFDAAMGLLTAVALGGVITGVRTRHAFLLAPVLLFMCFGAAHAITHMDLLYYYVKVPFLFLFAAYFLSTWWNWSPSWLVSGSLLCRPAPLVAYLLTSMFMGILAYILVG